MIHAEVESGVARNASTTLPHGPLLATIPARRLGCDAADADGSEPLPHATQRDCQASGAQLSITSHPGSEIHGLIDVDGNPFSQSALDNQQAIVAPTRHENDLDNKDHLAYSLISLMSTRELGSSLSQRGSVPNVRLGQGGTHFSARPPVSPPAHPVRHPNPLSMWSTTENLVFHQQLELIRNYSQRHRLSALRCSPVPANHVGTTSKQSRLPDPLKWRAHLATLSQADADELVNSTYETLYGVAQSSEALSAISANTSNVTREAKGSPETGSIRLHQQSTSDLLLNDFLLPKSAAEEDRQGRRGSE